MTWLWDNADKLGTVVMAIGTIAALVYAHLQISEGRRSERQANAHELWRDYLALAFDHPKLADPSLHLADFDYNALTIDGSAELFQKYEWFAGALLDACEEILEVSPTVEWRRTIRSQLRLHRDYLLSARFRNSESPQEYRPKFRAFLDEAVKEPPKPSLHSTVARIKAPKRKARAHA